MQIAIQDTYPDEFSHCYGCGRNNEHGHHIRTFPMDGSTLTEHRPEPFHLAGQDFTYGGVIASIIDCHSTGSAAIFWMQKNGWPIGDGPSPAFVTARLEVDYVAPTPLDVLRLVGSAVEIGERKVIVTTELSAAGQVTARGRAVLVRLA